MRLSYCYPEPDRIREGIRRLAGVIEEETELRQTFGPVAAIVDNRLHAPESPSPDLA
jgi:2-aminoadipate transaminase